MPENKYLHGYAKKEQDRLYHQARFLEPYVYAGVDLEFNQHLLEVGCGVGAQTKIILRRFPDLKVDCVDLAEAQLSLARKHLSDEIKAGRAKLFQQNAMQLKMKKKYDSAFICWFLEHVPDPIQVLIQVRKSLKPGSKIYCSEVFNQSLFMDPYSPNYLKYWYEFNDLQWTNHGHPFIGAKLGHLLKEAGFTDITTEVRPFHFDSRQPEKRAAFIEHFFEIILSAEKTLLESGRVTKKLVRDMKKEVEIAKKTKDSVFFDAFIRATARVP